MWSFLFQNDHIEVNVVSCYILNIPSSKGWGDLLKQKLEWSTGKFSWERNANKWNDNIVWNGYLVLFTAGCLISGSEPRALHTAVAQYMWDEWLTELMEIVKPVWIHNCKHSLILTNHFFLFLILSIFYTNFLMMWTQLLLKSGLKWLIHVLLSQSRISRWVLITSQPFNMEHNIVRG